MKNLTDFLKRWEPVWIRAWSTITIATHPPKLRVLKSGLILYVSTFSHLFFPGLRPVPTLSDSPYPRKCYHVKKNNLNRTPEPEIKTQ